MNDHEEIGKGERLSGREVAFAARDAAAFMEALWVCDRDRAAMLRDAAGDHERHAIAEALASLVGVALRTPEDTPPGRFVGIIRAMLDDGVDTIDGAGR